VTRAKTRSNLISSADLQAEEGTAAEDLLLRGLERLVGRDPETAEEEAEEKGNLGLLRVVSGAVRPRLAGRRPGLRLPSSRCAGSDGQTASVAPESPVEAGGEEEPVRVEQVRVPPAPARLGGDGAGRPDAVVELRGGAQGEAGDPGCGRVSAMVMSSPRISTSMWAISTTTGIRGARKTRGP